MGTRDSNFNVQRNFANTGKISSSLPFHRYFQVFQMKFKICIRHLVLLEMIYFEKILRVTQTELCNRMQIISV